ncbi:alpha/beta hydrolase [Streptomyces sp. NPDC057336]|uniref:alpha/beta hydrolase n=1 Tax=Streptomyces sp. NPDC057336 TaxID=3346102 RepID=UPI0036402CD1
MRYHTHADGPGHRPVDVERTVIPAPGRDRHEAGHRALNNVRATTAVSPAIEPAPRRHPPRDHAVTVPAGSAELTGWLAVPVAARGVVLLTGDGDWQDSTAALHRAGLGTLALSLWETGRSAERRNVFDVVMLARRLGAACDWLHERTGLPVGCAAGGTSAAAALEAAAEHDTLRAVVSVSGRPGLARPSALARVSVPVLLVTGDLDQPLLSRNRLAADWLRCPHRVVGIPDVADPVSSDAALHRVLRLTTDWFTDHVAGRA